MATPATVDSKAGTPSPKTMSFSTASLSSSIMFRFSTACAFSAVMEGPAQREVQRAPGTVPVRRAAHRVFR